MLIEDYEDKNIFPFCPFTFICFLQQILGRASASGHADTR